MKEEDVPVQEFCQEPLAPVVFQGWQAPAPRAARESEHLHTGGKEV